MIKRLGTVLGLLLMAVAAHAQSYVVDFTWTNNDQNYPVCSSTVTTYCELGKTMTDTTNGGSTVVCSGIAPSAAACTTTAYTAAQFAVGTTHTYALTVQYYGAVAGTVLNTAPDTASVTNGVGPGNPTNVGGTVRVVGQ